MIQNKGGSDNIYRQNRRDLKNEQRNIRRGFLGRYKDEIQKNKAHKKTFNLINN